MKQKGAVKMTLKEKLEQMPRDEITFKKAQKEILNTIGELEERVERLESKENK